MDTTPAPVIRVDSATQTDNTQVTTITTQTECTDPDHLDGSIVASMDLQEMGSNSDLVECDIASEPISFSVPMSNASEIQVGDAIQDSTSESQLSTSSSIYHLSRIETVIFTQSSCFICKNPKGRSLVPKAAVKQVWNDLSILIPLTNRCCKHHLNQEHRFIASDMEQITAAKVGINISSARFGEWLMAISSTKDQKPSTHRFSFEENGIVADDYKMLTSLTKDQFDEVYYEYLAGRLRNSRNRSGRDALGMLLMILRKNLTQDIVAFVF